MTIPVPNPQTFNWIRDALESSMDSVMSQVVQVERDDDYALLNGAPKSMHQIYGSLLMVELEAAGMLAQDLETLCSRISSADNIGEKARGLKVFRRGMEALQGYVDAIARQQPVSPLVLADQINNVRSIVDGTAITGFDLFTPPLDLLDMGDVGYNDKPIPLDLRVRLVTQLRKKYRRALLKWLTGASKGRQGKPALKKLSSLLQHLGRVSSLDVSRQLWWVASGFVDAVSTGELEAEKGIKSQFAKLDDEISRLEEESAANIATDPPDDLLRQMLFYIGSVGDAASDSETIGRIKQDLDLTKWFGGMDDDYKSLVETTAKLELVNKVFSSEDFDEVEILVSESFAGYEGESGDKILDELSQKLGKLTSNANDHGIGAVGELVDNVVNAVRNVDKSDTAIAQTAADIKIASALLFLRDIVSNPASIDVTWAHSVSSHQEELTALIGQTEASRDRVQQVEKIAQVEYQHARSAVVLQIRETLSAVENSINILRDGLAPQESLHEAKSLANVQLEQVSAAFGIVEADAAVDLGREIQAVVSKLPTGSQDADDSAVNKAFEDLAYAIAALDVAADNVSQRQRSSNDLLTTAAERLAEVELDSLDDAGDGVDSETLEKLEKRATVISELELARQALDASDVSSSSAMIKTFAALTETSEADAGVTPHSAEVAHLAQIGQDVSSLLASGDMILGVETEDFLGLLVRQLREIQDSDAASEVDTEGWEKRYAALLANEAKQLDTSHTSVSASEESPADSDDIDEVSLSDSVGEQNVISGSTAVETLDSDLKAIFIEEFGNHIHLLRRSTGVFSASPLVENEVANTIDEVENCVHTLAGNCRNLGFDEAATCAEYNLTLLESIAGSNGSVNPAVVSAFEGSVDLLEKAHESIGQIGRYNAELGQALTNYDGNGFLPEGPSAIPDVSVDAGDDADAGTDAPAGAVPETIDAVDASMLSAQPLVESSQESAADDAAEVDDDIDEEIRQIFLEESETILGSINAHLMDWRDKGADSKALAGIRREFHTLKGSAAATGYTGVSGLSHSIESLLEGLKPDEDVTESGLLELLEEMHDGLAADLGFMASGKTGHIAALRRTVSRYLGEEVETESIESNRDQLDVVDSGEGSNEEHVAVEVGEESVNVDSDIDEVDEKNVNEETVGDETDEVIGNEVSGIGEVDKENVSDESVDDDVIGNEESGLDEVDEENVIEESVAAEGSESSAVVERAVDEDTKGVDLEEQALAAGDEESTAESALDHVASDSGEGSVGEEDDAAESDKESVSAVHSAGEFDGEDIDTELVVDDVDESLDEGVVEQKEIEENAIVEDDASASGDQEAALEETSVVDDAIPEVAGIENIEQSYARIFDSEVVGSDGDNEVEETVEVSQSGTAPENVDESSSVDLDSDEDGDNDGAALSAFEMPVAETGDLADTAEPDFTDPESVQPTIAAPQPLADSAAIESSLETKLRNLDTSHVVVKTTQPKFGGQLKNWVPLATLIKSDEDEDAEAGSGNLRIAGEKLAELINASGELGLGRTQLQNTLEATRMDLDLLRSSMSSMREGLRDLEIEAEAQIRARPEEQALSHQDEFDPLQLDRYSNLQAKSREVTELLDQLAKVERGLGNRASVLTGTLQQQQHLGQQLQSGLMSARMVSAADYVPRLRYLVRESARQAGKKVQLDFIGGEIKVDRQVIESMMAPFEHMIRNAIAHGIETPEERVAAGKPEQGVIKIELNQQGTELAVDVNDDGRGLDVTKLANTAKEIGLAKDAGLMTEVDMLQVVTQPGFSTAKAITMESGRGVGMDVVYQAVRDLSGSMGLHNYPGKGLEFYFRLPVTLAVTQALLVKVGSWQFALRSRTISRLVRVNPAEVGYDDEQRSIVVENERIPLISMRQRLGEADNTDTKNSLAVVVVRLADRLAGFEVDDFGDAVDIVSKTAGRQLLSIPEFAGVTILGDNTVTMVLDPEVFFDRYRSTMLSSAAEEGTDSDGSLRRVLVVDDSLVVRKVMQRDLEGDGLEVETAIDGVNALEVLENTDVDVALVDIEMPRMNGYELLEKLRSDERYQRLPVIIITSRSGDQHKQRALSLGADGYITKPYDIGSLDTLMRQVVESRKTIH